MLDWYRSLIEARRTYPALRNPAPDSTRFSQHFGLITVERGHLALVCNITDEPHHVELREVLLASTGLASHRELPPLSCAVVRR
jgi:hypothetical protein